MDRFAIVEFTEENAVDVVPESWIEKQDEVFYCYYPRSNIQTRVRRMELPDKKLWSSYRIRILSYTDKYDKAVKRAKKAEETSQIETSDSEQEIGQTRKRRRQEVNYEEYEHDEENRKTKPIQTKKARHPKPCENAHESNRHGNMNQIGKSLLVPNPPAFLPRTPLSHRKTNSVGQVSGLHLYSTPSMNRSAEVIENRNTEQVQAKKAQHPKPCEDIPRPRTQSENMQRNDSSLLMPNPPAISPRTSLSHGKTNSVGQVSGLHLHSTPSTTRSAEVIDELQFSPPGDDDCIKEIFQSISSELQEMANDGQATSKNSESTQNYRTNVIVKLDTIIENQNEILVYLRQQSSKTQAAYDVVLEDVLPRPMDTLGEIQKLCLKLEQSKFKNTLVSYLAAQCGHSLGDTVRRIMAKLGTNKLWSLYSFKGRKGKLAFKGLNLCNVIIKSCVKCHEKATEPNIEEQISETLKHAPNKPGGSRYQTIKVHNDKCVFVDVTIDYEHKISKEVVAVDERDSLINDHRVEMGSE
ncbi:transposase domain-containing [Paramuricea clavata]|uniref:Transposase domain-containing n=1 Tax=Paramuricea clavata TaxID=317549 RepID=A0A7D9D5N5_PARCT|nr:transposase domain-containing [Paramuricea clavata]